MSQKTIQTNYGLYEVHSMYNGRENTSVFSCENDCPNCRTKCEFGVNMISTTRGHDYIVGV